MMPRHCCTLRQRPQVSPAETIRFGLLQSAQQYHRTGVRVFLSPDLLILDDLGLHRLTAQQSADRYELILNQ